MSAYFSTLIDSERDTTIALNIVKVSLQMTLKEAISVRRSAE